MVAKRAFVTGATGFIGRNVAKYFAQQGWQVHALSRTFQSSCLNDHNLVWHKYDGSYSSLACAIASSRPEIVLHLASLFLSTHKSDDIDALIDSNFRLGVHLLEAMSKYGVNRLINVGTSWQHYNDSAYSPVNLYAATNSMFLK